LALELYWKNEKDWPAHVSVCEYVNVRDRERQRETERDRERQRETERKKESRKVKKR
jgi:hypothetical protein